MSGNLELSNAILSNGFRFSIRTLANNKRTWYRLTWQRDPSIKSSNYTFCQSSSDFFSTSFHYLDLKFLLSSGFLLIRLLEEFFGRLTTKRYWYSDYNDQTTKKFAFRFDKTTITFEWNAKNLRFRGLAGNPIDDIQQTCFLTKIFP